MSLKQRVVIVSKFGAKAGATPGRYIRRYTTRLDATEGLVPYTEVKNPGHYINEYMTRQEASDDVIEHVGTIPILQDVDDKVTPQSSRLFGNRGLVYTASQFETAIHTTEQALEDNHTLITPVISFRHDFLVDHGVVPKDMLEPKTAGEYKGQVDQLKLRRAISKGMDDLCRDMGFVEPEWTAAIQLDTKHVHAHVTLIETCDASKVPDKRIVKSPRKEWVVKEKDGRQVKCTDFVRDEQGQIIYDHLGERGKINDSAKKVFRRGLERELVYSKGSKAFTNQLSAHYTVVKDNSLVLALTNSKLQMSIMQVYDALPKRLNGDEALSEEQALKRAQQQWRMSTNRVEMRDAKEKARQFAKVAIQDHGAALGMPAFSEAVDNYTRNRAPDTDGNSQQGLRERLKARLFDKLENNIAMSLFQALKPVRLRGKDEPNPSMLLEQENAQVLGVPVTNETLPVEGVIVPKALRFSALTDKQVKNMVADGFEQSGEVFGKELAMEWRLRSYPRRFEYATREHSRYNRLLQEYDDIDAKTPLPENSRAMRTLYAVESWYHEAVSDKYRFLLNQTKGSTVHTPQGVYPLPYSDENGHANWSQWADDYEVLLHTRAEKRERLVENFPQPEELSVLQKMPEEVWRVLVDSNDDTPAYSQLYLNPKTQFKAQAVLAVAHGFRDQALAFAKVDERRFRDVKSFDMMDVVYDFDATMHRSVSEQSWQTYKQVVATRASAYDGALGYLEDTDQKYAAYNHYKGERERVREEEQFIAAVELHCKQEKRLPYPVRQGGNLEDDLKTVEGVLTIPPEVSRALGTAVLRNVRKKSQKDAKDLQNSEPSLENDPLREMQAFYLARHRREGLVDIEDEDFAEKESEGLTVEASNSIEPEEIKALMIERPSAYIAPKRGISYDFSDRL